MCNDCFESFFLNELTSCQGKPCLGDTKSLLCVACKFSAEGCSCLCYSCFGMFAQQFRESQTRDATMSDAQGDGSLDKSVWEDRRVQPILATCQCPLLAPGR